MANSRYVQLTPYALLEYEYSIKSYASVSQNLLRITDTTDNTVQFLNVNSSVSVTGNVMDRSSFNILGNRWAHLDIDRPVPYIDSVDFLEVSTLTDITDTPFNVSYDRVRVHMLSGYNLEDLEGFIIEITYPEKSGKNATAATQTFLKGDTFVVFNPRPILLGERTYDRYIEFLVPALDNLNSEFYADPDNPTGELAYYLTSDHLGFNPDGLIGVALHEIGQTKIENGQLYLLTDQTYDVSLNQADRFDKLAAVIQESSNGDCFEYYPTWDGGFISDYISNLNSVGGDYAVLHNIRVFSQVGFSQIEEQSFTEFQDSGLDKPKKIRPIIQNSDAAYAFSIDYTMSLYDKNGSIQIIRRASVTSYEPKKYGLHLERIEVKTGNQLYRIYNKVVDGSTFVLPQITNISKIETVYVPTFYQMNNIAVSSETVIIDASAEVTSEKFLDSSYIFGQGDAIILLSPFDNYVKFRLYKALGRTQTPETMDLSHSMDIQLVFIDDTGTKRRFSRIRTQLDIKPESGDLLFRVPTSDSQKILMFSSNKFYLTTQAEIINDTNPIDEVPLYTGIFMPYDQIDEAIAQINVLKEDKLLAKAQTLRIKEAQLTALSSSLSDLQKHLDQEQQQLALVQQQQDLAKQQLSSQQISLDAKSKLIDDQSTLLKNREDEIKSFVKETQEQENSAIAQFQQLLASLDTKLKSQSNPVSDSNPGSGTTDIKQTITLGGDLPSVPPNIGQKSQSGGVTQNTPVTPTSGILVASANPNLLGISVTNPRQQLSTLINVVEIPGKFGNDMSISPRFAATPINATQKLLSVAKNLTGPVSGKSSSGTVTPNANIVFWDP